MKRNHVNQVKHPCYAKQNRTINLIIMSVALGLILIQLITPDQQVMSYDVDIPDEAIRLRILAHSDDEIDQAMKHLVRDEVSQFVADRMTMVTSIAEAREVVTASLTEIEQVVASTLEEADYSHSATVTYGKNIVFPTKVYDTHVYPQGEYEAVLITIGDGAGKNCWCVLFPGLCFIDFNGDVTLDESHPQEKEIDEGISVVDNNESEDKVRETEALSKTKDQGERKPKAKFWLVEQITTLIHKFGG
jgi:stage II sporulation protein R